MMAFMDPMLKWIGGATAAIVLALGTATVAGSAFSATEPAEQASLAEAIPVDAQQVAAAAPGQVDATSAPQPTAVQEVAKPADERFVIKRVLPIKGPIKYGEWHWDEEGVPDGPLVMTVDLEARVISVFRGGYEIGAAAVLLGTQDHPTPLGTFPILQKKRHNISSIYNVPMPYTMRLTWDGIAIHASEVENGYASHGCIGTPEGFAAKLFAIVQKGDKVIITRGKQIGVGDPIIS
ncbi:MAG: L,D-transpeptidase family protein [Sphingomonadaceae bacterium]